MFDVRIFQTLESQCVSKATTFKDEPLTQMEEIRVFEGVANSIDVTNCHAAHQHAQNLGNEWADHVALSVLASHLNHDTHALVGPDHQSPILQLRDKTTLMTLCRFHAMQELHAQAPQRLVISWGCGSRRVSLHSCVHVSVSCLLFGRLHAIWLSQCRHPLILVGNGRIRHLVWFHFFGTTFGTLCWSYSFTCRLAHSWKHVLLKLTFLSIWS